uniref:CHK domain-containing protein n=1 Tax=Caenorhabditis japonica TaxID=281687 RepID=A0A8R1I7H6_CAEJA
MVTTRKVLEDVGAGKGHLSTVQLVFDEKLERNVILKIPGGEMSKKILSIQDDRFAKLHNTEVNVYEILKIRNDTEILYPRIFDMEHMDINSEPRKHGFIVMEYIKGITHLYPNDCLTPEELVDPVRHLARLHSLAGKLTDEEKKLVPRDFLSGWFSELFTEKNVNLFMGHWRGKMAELMPSTQSKEAIGLLTEILKPENFQTLNDDCKESGIQEVLCHGDYAASNLLFEKLPDGSRKFKSICDFQGSNWGNAAQDLTRLFVTAMSGKDRRESGEHLLQIYYDELVRVTGGNAPFTWQQLTRSYTRFLPHHAAVVCITTPGWFFRSLTQKEGAENEKEELERVMVEKYVTLMEDLNTAWKESWLD